MRIRLWAVAAICLLPLALVTATATAQERGTQITQNSAPEQFQKVPNIPDCATAAVQQGDPAKGVSVLLIKGTAGCNVPWHFHTPNEQLMMVSGTGRVQMKDQQPVLLRPGGFAYAPSKHVHQFACAGRACEFFLRSDGPFDTHYVDQSGKEIPLEQALSAAKK